MKFNKFIPALAAALVLSACAKTEKVEAASIPAMQASQQAVVYQCQGKEALNVNYHFEGKNAVAADVTVGKKALKESLKLDATNKDFTSFVAGDYVLNVDTGLNADNASSTPVVMLTEKGKKADKILAKNCDVKAAK